MRYAIISDIHANLEALQATVKDIKNTRAEEVICLGDIVGYYPNPNECAELCRTHGFRCLRGNHDDAAVGSCGIEDFNPVAQAALRWTANELSQSNKEWLRRLPEKVRVDENVLAVHGAPWHPYAYIFFAEDTAFAFSHLRSHYSQVQICFFGHTHQKALFSSDTGPIQLDKKKKFQFHDPGLYLVNPGSVGQARDGRPGASYLIYDSETREIQFRHVPYDLNLTRRKVIATGLPLMLAERLALGY